MSESAKAVFLSYASQDAEAARRICEALRAAGVEVWFDQDALVGGDAWDQKIRGQVSACALFVPVISANTQERQEGYFRLEWHLAEQRSLLIAKGRPFIVPVSIDATSERGALVPEAFTAVQWTKLPTGEPTAAFVARVKHVLNGPSTPASSALPVPLPPGESATPTPRPSGTSMRLTVAVAASVLGAIVYFALRPVPEEPASPQKLIAETSPTNAAPPAAAASPRNGPKSIVVLPFANMSDSKDSGYFADGVHEDVVTNLAAIHELYVTSRTTAVQYRDTKKTLRQIGEELGVAFVLEGSVRRDGKKLRITGQLIRAGTDGYLWANKYDRELNDVFAIQSEIATAIAGELKAIILPREKKFIERRPTSNLVAYDLYLQERALRNLSSKTPEERLSLLKAAVDLDPNFAEAWAGMAEILPFGIRTGRFPESERGFAKTAVDTAVRLAPELPEVILAQGRYAWQTERDIPKAVELFERAANLFPNFSDAHIQLGRIYRAQGRFAAAVVSFSYAVRLDQSYRNAESSMRALLDAGRRYGELRDHLRRRLESDPANLRNRYELAKLLFLGTGSAREVDLLFSELTTEEADSTEARQLRASWLVRTGNFAGFKRHSEISSNKQTQSVGASGRELNMAFFLAAQGNLLAARTELRGVDAVRALRDRQPTLPIRWATLAQWEVLLGNNDEAFRCAQKARELATESLAVASYESTLARVHTWTGDKDRAIQEYARLLRVPFSGLNVHEMKHDPAYAPLCGDPRFEALLNDQKNNAPLF